MNQENNKNQYSGTENVNDALSLLQATLESTEDGILVVDRSSKIVKFNNRFLKMWRIPQDIVATHDDDKAITFVLSQLVEPDAFVAKVKELYSKPEAESFDTLNFKDGRVFERYSIPQKIGENIVGRVWSFRDVTERVNSEKKAQDYMHAIERANKLLVERQISMIDIGNQVGMAEKAKLDAILKVYADGIESLKNLMEELKSKK